MQSQPRGPYGDARGLPPRAAGVAHLVYASSSSVYGGNTKLPFAVEDRVDQPISLYAATKRADELMSHCYSAPLPPAGDGPALLHGLRPLGPARHGGLHVRRRDHSRAGRSRSSISGEMQRDFTYIDDIVAGVLAALDRPPAARGRASAPHRLYNLGNHRPVELLPLRRDARAGARPARPRSELAPMQPGDVVRTCADIEASRRDLGFEPQHHDRGRPAALRRLVPRLPPGLSGCERMGGASRRSPLPPPP